MAKLTITDIKKKKDEGRRISMISAYDFPFAQAADEAGMDMLIVGDSLAMVVQGLDNTLSVTMDEMIYHCRMVARAAKNALVVGDMPYMSYQVSVEEAVRNAGRFIKEGGASAIKMEGGSELVPHIKAMSRAEIPVMAHIGLTPQAIHRMGGFKVQGKTEEARKRLMEEARAVEDAGAFSLVIEAVPMDLAKSITESISIPTIGIGAGPHCDGQVLVLHDVIGLFERFTPKFVKKYANLKPEVVAAISAFKADIESGAFPSEEQSFK